MNVSWSVSPKGSHDVEYFFDEDSAYDAAYDWSVELSGRPVIIYCNNTPWTEVTT